MTISLRIIVVTCYFLFYFSKRLKCSFRANCYLCFKCIFRSNCYLRFNSSLYFVCWIITKSVLDRYEWFWPQYDCYRSRRRHINSPTLLVNSRSPFANSPTPIKTSAKWPRMPSKWPVCRRVDQVRLLVSWPKASASWHVTVVTGYLKFTLVLQFKFQMFLLFSYLSLVKNSVHWTHHTGCSCSKHFLYLRKGGQNITLSFAK